MCARIESNAKELKLHPVSEGEGKRRKRGVDVHLIDDPVARLGLELGAPVASGGGGGVRVDATGGSDGSRVGPLRGAPVGGAVHGLRPGRLSSSFSLEI
jgi:hypothetical protein